MVVEERCTSDTSFFPPSLLAYSLIGQGEASSPPSVSAKDKKTLKTQRRHSLLVCRYVEGEAERKKRKLSGTPSLLFSLLSGATHKDPFPPPPTPEANRTLLGGAPKEAGDAKMGVGENHCRRHRLQKSTQQTRITTTHSVNRTKVVPRSIVYTVVVVCESIKDDAIQDVFPRRVLYRGKV